MWHLLVQEPHPVQSSLWFDADSAWNTCESFHLMFLLFVWVLRCRLSWSVSPLTAESSLDVESKRTVHYQAPWHKQKNILQPSTRPACVEELYGQANFSLWTLSQGEALAAPQLVVTLFLAFTIIMSFFFHLMCAWIFIIYNHNPPITVLNVCRDEWISHVRVILPSCGRLV